LAWRLLRRNFTVALFDIDDVRRELFGQADIDAPIGSDDNKRMYAAAHEYLFKDAIPQAIRSGAIPIMVATHSRRELYDRAFEVSEKCRATLKFVLLEPPSIEETIRRAESDTTSVSDTKNLAGDPDQMREYQLSTERFLESYKGKTGNYTWIPQGEPEKMVRKALRYVLGTDGREGRIEGLLFDVDGLLVDTERLKFQVWQELVLLHSSSPLTQEEFLPLIGLSGKRVGEEICRIKGFSLSYDAMNEFRRPRTAELRRTSLSAISENVALVREFAEDGSFALGVISSEKRPVLEENLRFCGIRDLFEVVVGEPKDYQRGLDELGLSAETCLAFEDSPNGIAAAKKAGIRCIALPNELTDGLNLDQADLVIRSGEARSAQMILEKMG